MTVKKYLSTLFAAQFVLLAVNLWLGVKAESDATRVIAALFSTVNVHYCWKTFVVWLYAMAEIAKP